MIPTTSPLIERGHRPSYEERMVVFNARAPSD
jgi:hypothetical protein